MKTTATFTGKVLCLLLGVAFWLAPLAAATSTFSDGFEGTSLNPFWTVTGPGTAGLTSAFAYSGSQSAQLSLSSTFPWSVSLSHDFGSDQSGTASVYVHTELCCGSSASAELALTRSNGDWANLQTWDNNNFGTRVQISGVQTGNTVSSPTSASWHLFEIRTDSSGVTVKLDGNTVLTNSSLTTFRYVSLDVWGAPSAGSGYFDDFSATVASNQPLYNVCLLYDPTKVVKSGSTIPIKLQLCDGGGNDLSSSNITAHAISLTQTSTSISGDVQDSGNSNPDNDFRFDPALGSTGGYIFNLSTKGLTTGTYTLNFTVTGDSFVYAAPFQVK